MLRYIFPKHGRNGEDFFGIESNPNTREIYSHYGIDSLKVKDFFEFKFPRHSFSK